MNENEIKIKNRISNQLSLIRRFQTLEALESTGEHEAVNALTKIWDPGILSRAHQQGVSLLERVQKELELLGETQLELDFELWLLSPDAQTQWTFITTQTKPEDGNYSLRLTALVVDRFMFATTLAVDYKKIWEYCDWRARKEIKERNDAE